MAKPLITANQVTLLRLVLLPIGSWLMYQGERGQFIALIFMTLVGCTDFVDGWLARKYGPTVLGGLMDPIADKVFIVVIFLPIVDLGWVPAWLVWALLLREFLVTGLRSLYERRGLKLKSTFLAKVKTWAQMGGAGVIFLMQVPSIRGTTMEIVLLVGVLSPLIFMGIRYLVKGYLWLGALVFSGWFGGTLVVYRLAGHQVATQLLALAILAVTWVSGWGYLSQSLNLLRTKPLDRIDYGRLLAGVLIPCVVIFAQVQKVLPSLALILIMSMEMAVGGLDNLLCHHHAQSGALPWGARVFTLSFLLALAAYATMPGSALLGLGPVLTWCACGVCLVGSIYEFVRGRTYYLDTSLQEKPLDL